MDLSGDDFYEDTYFMDMFLMLYLRREEGVLRIGMDYWLISCEYGISFSVICVKLMEIILR